MGVRPVFEWLWAIVALGLAWIGGAIGGYAGLRYGLAYGGLFLLALIWGTLLRGYGPGGRRLTVIFQTVAAGGPVAALAVTVAWPVLFSWYSYQLDNLDYLPYLAGAVAAGLITALCSSLYVDHTGLSAEGGFPESRALAGLFVNRWRTDSGRGPAAFFRGTLVGLVARLTGKGAGLFPEVLQVGLTRFSGWNLGLAVMPCFLGIGGLLGRRKAGEILAGSLASLAIGALVINLSAPGGPAAAANPNLSAVLFGVGALTSALIIAGFRKGCSWVGRDPWRLLMAAVGALALSAVIFWFAQGPMPAKTGLFTALTFAIAAPMCVMGFGYLGSIGTPATSLLAGLAAMPTIVAGLWRVSGSEVAASVSMAVVAAIVTAGYLQSRRTNIYLAGPRPLGVKTMLSLQTVGVMSGFAGAIWATRVITEEAAFGTTGFPAGAATLVGGVLAASPSGTVLPLLLTGAACALAIEFLDRRSGGFALGSLVPFPVALAVAIGAWVTGEPSAGSRAQAVSSGLVAGDLLGSGSVAFAAAWGYLNLPNASTRPWGAIAQFLALICYLIWESFARNRIRGLPTDTLAMGSRPK